MSEKIIDLEDKDVADLMKRNFFDYYYLERKRRIQETIAGESTFHTKSIEQALREIKDAILTGAWDKTE